MSLIHSLGLFSSVTGCPGLEIVV